MIKLTHQLCIILAIACSFSLNQFSFASSHSKDTVNILTWWGYLDSPQLIKQIEDNCNVSVSFDEYYSDEELIRRLKNNAVNYDIAIMSEKAYKAVSNSIPNLPSSRLHEQSYLYNKLIKEHYEQLNYPHNVVYFAHSFDVFLWNPKLLTVTENDSILDLFKKSKHHKVAMMDDAIEESELMNSVYKENKTNLDSDKFDADKFENIMQGTKWFITNNYSRIYEDKDFAMALAWSGEAINNIKYSNKQYKLLVHPNLSKSYLICSHK